MGSVSGSDGMGMARRVVGITVRIIEGGSRGGDVCDRGIVRVKEGQEAIYDDEDGKGTR